MHLVHIRLLQFPTAGYPQTVIKPPQQVLRTLQPNSSFNLVQPRTAKLILESCTAEHAKPHLKQLHWLPIKQRIFETQNSFPLLWNHHWHCPQYLAEPVQIYVPSRSLRSSSDDRTSRIPTFKRKQHGGRAFASLPHNLELSSFHSPSQPFPPCLQN